MSSNRDRRTTRTRVPPLGAAWVCLMAALVAGCSDDADAKPDASDGRARCQPPGIAGQCMCGAGQNGTTICGEDGYWRTCSCVSLPPGTRCRDGESLRCTNLCPGEKVGRMTRCVGGDYDCRCAADDDAGP